MGWRSGELRVGRAMAPALVDEDSITGKSTTRIDIVYCNEGHPYNKHRDGFALQATYTGPLNGTFTAELSAGPYSSVFTAAPQAGREVGRSGTLEAKPYGGKWALSVKAVLEGDDQGWSTAAAWPGSSGSCSRSPRTGRCRPAAARTWRKTAAPTTAPAATA